MSRSLVYTLHLWPPLGHAKHYTGSTRNLRRRLAEHALGRGARLPQVQVERGGSWVVAQTEPGARDRERQLKNEGGAARRCRVCKAVKGFQAGELSQEQALARAGWDRASQYDRGLLLAIFGLPRETQYTASTAGPAGGVVTEVPAPRPPSPGARFITPEIVALVDQLETAWSAMPRGVAAGAEPEAGQ